VDYTESYELEEQCKLSIKTISMTKELHFLSSSFFAAPHEDAQSMNSPELPSANEKVYAVISLDLKVDGG
jgi:hypothetical protein